MSSEEYQIWHGFKGKKSWPLPKIVARSDKANRADQNNMIKANEYLDDPEVLNEKIDIVVDLIKKSKNCVTYTGAGLSKASGIPDYASKSEESIVKTKKIKSSLDAQPTYGHLVLTALERAGYLKHWVQQNHDGLPQKAGFPQEKINEIHGAWFDPSNPVVQFSGSLRGDLFDWMAEWEKKADLCLCLGTSLSGMNADRMANTPAKKSLKGQALGTVLINLQQTPLDERCVVRIWAKLDDAFKMIEKRLGLDVKPRPIVLPEGDVFKIPYDEEGKKNEMCCMTLNLKTEAKIKIVAPGASNINAEGVINGKRDGNWSVGLKEKEGIAHRLFGAWWIESALIGVIPQLPLVNLNPKVETLSQPFVYTYKRAEVQPRSNSNSNGTTISSTANENSKEKVKTSTLTSTVEKMEIDVPPKDEILELPKTLKVIQFHYEIEARESDNNHKWGLELEPGAEKYVREVVYLLHPTFRQREMKIKDAPFRISMLGWGTFVVGIKVTLKNGKQYETSHKLTFKENGPQVRVTEITL